VPEEHCALKRILGKRKSGSFVVRMSRGFATGRGNSKEEEPLRFLKDPQPAAGEGRGNHRHLQTTGDKLHR